MEIHAFGGEFHETSWNCTFSVHHGEIHWILLPAERRWISWNFMKFYSHSSDACYSRWILWEITNFHDIGPGHRKVNFMEFHSQGEFHGHFVQFSSSWFSLRENAKAHGISLFGRKDNFMALRWTKIIQGRNVTASVSCTITIMARTIEKGGKTGTSDDHTLAVKGWVAWNLNLRWKRWKSWKVLGRFKPIKVLGRFLEGSNQLVWNYHL